VLLQETPLSIIIGVTGHRDPRPQDIAPLQSVFEAELRAIATRYPDSSFVLLSSLAEGCDRLAARVALGLGVRLVVPLPLPRALYEEDFVSPDSRAEFEDLLGRAVRVIDLPLLPGVSEADVRQQGAARDLEYAKVGEYIGRQSQIFFAFWDGRPGTSETIGGTGYTVQLRLSGRTVQSGLSRRFRTFSITSGPVIQIETVRQRNRDPQVSTGTKRVLLPAGTREEAFELICARMNQFNRDARLLSGPLSAGRDGSQAQLLNTDIATAPGVLTALPLSCQYIADHYVLADGLALHFARRTNAALKNVSLGVAAAAVFFNLHSSYFGVPDEAPASLSEAVGSFPWYMVVFLVLSTYTAGWLYGRAERGEYQTRYLDYRSLAEALRIQFFWRITGVKEVVVDNYLRNQRSELEWLRAALKSFDVMATDSGTRAAPPAGANEFGLLMAWIQDQRRYFSRKAKIEERRRRFEAAAVQWLLKASGVMSILLGLALAVPFIGRLVFQTPWRWPVSSGWHALLMVVIPMLAVGAGLLDRYSRQVAREEHIRQFASMSTFFDAGERELDALLKDGRYAAATDLARNLGLEALDDNGDWLILHRERPLELPPG
jgi:hypothetical protein